VSSHSSKTGDKRRASTSTSTNKASGAGPINIEIGGQRLNIRSDRDSAFVQHLARYIDHKLEELQNAAPTMPMNKLLILASMTVAEELFESREELRQMRRQLKDTTQTMFDLIDQAEEV
jgi:cell division protein ZapA (FtsZ GTPase activity inhibitor)